MHQPWGLSGPQFLVIYGVAIGVVLVVPFLLRLLIRFASSADADRQLHPYEVGYLAGGPTRTAQVVIAGFTASGAVRVDSSGRVTVADRAALGRRSAFLSEGVADAPTLFPELWLPAGVSVPQFQGKIAQLSAIAAIQGRLQADGFLVSRTRSAMVRNVSLTLWAALFVTGGLRLAEGALNHRPIHDLEGLVVLCVFFCLYSVAAGNWIRPTDLTTFRGAGLLRRLRSTERHREKEAARQSRRGVAVFSPGLAGNGFGPGTGTESAALFGVALAGFAAIADESTRSALLAHLPRFYGGSSCGGGGGGGCGGGGGGGGCGGGGCGG
jgi:uncharacterized protein (TIGR04222 family)